MKSVKIKSEEKTIRNDANLRIGLKEAMLDEP